MELTQEEKDFQGRMREFAREVIEPKADESIEIQFGGNVRPPAAHEIKNTHPLG